MPVAVVSTSRHRKSRRTLTLVARANCIRKVSAVDLRTERGIESLSAFGSWWWLFCFGLDVSVSFLVSKSL